MNKDYLGYYIVGDYKTYSKIEALEYSCRVGRPVKWIYNDLIFRQHPWHVDTHKDIRQLYKERAEQLREKYDYLVILYSGGADSFTVMKSFFDNDIHVDEVVNMTTLAGEKSWNTIHNQEVKEVAIPETEKFLEGRVGTKHTVLDLTEIIETIYKKDNNTFDFLYNCNNCFGPHMLSRSYFKDVPHWKKLIEQGKTVCWISGHDRPPIVYDQTNDRYFLQYPDTIDHGAAGPLHQRRNIREENFEAFYWSPDAVDLQTRQCHILINYLRNPPPEDLDSMYLSSNPYQYQWDYTGQKRMFWKPRPTTLINGVTYYLNNEGINRLIYPDWQEDTFTVGKNYGFMFSVKDRWWWMNHDDHAQRMVAGGLMSLYQKFTDRGFAWFKNHREELNFDVKHMRMDTYHSQRYYLEQLSGSERDITIITGRRYPSK
jgi:hypothetical protein